MPLNPTAPTVHDERQGSRKSREESAWANFQRDTESHALADVHEGAGMRRLVVKRPGSWSYGYVVTTWPGHLAVTGDMGAWVFTRSPDMFEFFRGKVGSINPGYWATKVEAADRHSAVMEFDMNTLRDFLHDMHEDEPERLATYLEALEAVESEDERGAIEALTEAGLEDAYDSNRKEFGHRFLWICHAIVFAIAKYDERKAAAVVA